MKSPLLAALIAWSATGVVGLEACHAEGNQDFGGGALGVNRRVQSPAGGQTRTAGNLTLEFFQPVSSGGGFDFNVNPRDNKPTAYLGGQAVLTDDLLREVEGGLQFETGVFDGVVGWSCFIARANVGGGNTYTNVRVWNGTASVAWRDPALYGIQRDPVTNMPIGATGAVISNMAFEIVSSGATDRSYTLQVNVIGQGNNTFYWNENQSLRQADVRVIATALHPIAPWGADNFNSTNQNQATAKSRVKRITGQTRRNIGAGTANDPLDNPAALDGSWVRGTWANATLGISNVPWHRIVNNVTITSVDQSETGYNGAPGGSGENAYDKRFSNRRTNPSRTIVEFSGAGLTNLTAREQVDEPARYNGETTTINLGTATRLQGQAVEWE